MKMDFMTSILFISFAVLFIEGIVFSIWISIKVAKKNEFKWKVIEKDLGSFQESSLESKYFKELPLFFKILMAAPLVMVVISFFSIWFSPFFEYMTQNSETGIKLSSIYVIIIVLITLLIIILTKPIENLIIKQKIKANNNQMMAIPTDDTIGELSYMLNSSIEKEKDFLATILNLVAKKCIKIEKTGDQFKIIDLEYNIDTLEKDEKYVYDWIISKDKSDYSYLQWRKIIIESVSKKEIFEDTKYNIAHKMSKVFIAIFILFFILTATGIIYQYKTLSIILFGILGTTFAITFISNLITQFMHKKTYTTKGAKIVRRWGYFKKYLKVYSNLKQAEIESVVIWDKYLAYAVALNINLNYKKMNIKDVPLELFLKNNSFKESISEVMDQIS